jgi:glycosyltransferase involved in cell wall biosynthesis
LKVLFVGENIYKSKGGIVTVMDQILSDTYLQNNVTYIPIFTSGDGFNFFQKVFGWAKAIIKFAFNISSVDVVHIHHAANFNFYLNSFLLNWAKLFNKKVLLHNHAADFKEFYLNETQQQQLKIKNAFLKADASIVLSNSWLKWYSNLEPNANWIYLANAIRIDIKRSSCDINHSKIILFLGRLEQRKGIYDLLSIFPEITTQFPNIKLLLAGNGDLKEIKKIIRNSNCEKNIEMLGYLNNEEKSAILSYSDIFVLPSYNEGLPMALLECMSYGLVPIASNVGGIPEVVRNGENGLLIEAGDIVALKESIIKILNDSSLSTLLSNNAKETIHSNFNLDNYVRDLLKLYMRL